MIWRRETPVLCWQRGSSTRALLQFTAGEVRNRQRGGVTARPSPWCRCGSCTARSMPDTSRIRSSVIVACQLAGER